MRIRYHLDEHINPAIAAGLRRRGIDVTTTADAGLENAADSEQLAYADSTGRVLITRDKDFLVLSSQGVAHAGIAFWHSKHRSIGRLIGRLTILWRTMRAEEMTGRIQFL